MSDSEPETPDTRASGPRAVSIVIPTYNEAARIEATVVETLNYLKTHYPDFELLVVDDGSSDATPLMVKRMAASEPRMRCLRLGRNMGKGAAVRAGMLAATGRSRLFMDADMSTPIEELKRLQATLAEGYDVVIASRGLAASEITERQPLWRELMGKAFNRIVRQVVAHEYSDTQCGFKLFSGFSAREIFSRQTVDRFAFDVEILVLARALGMKVCEVPVTWHHSSGSKVSPLGDSARMLVDLLRIRFRLARQKRTGKLRHGDQRE